MNKLMDIWDVREEVKQLQKLEEDNQDVSTKESISAFAKKLKIGNDGKLDIEEEPELYECEIVGEFFRDVGIIVNDEDVHDFPVECLIYLEDDNPYDKNAVACGIMIQTDQGFNSKQVGYLAREEAKLLRQKLKKLHHTEEAIWTIGYITGHDNLYGVTAILPFSL